MGSADQVSSKYQHWKIWAMELLGRVKKVSAWSFPAKLLLTGLVGGLGGTGLVSFLSEYATYFYSLSHGVRPPAEGIPYLKASVSLGSLFLLATAALVFFVVIAIFKFFVSNFTASEKILGLLATKEAKTKLDIFRNEVARPGVELLQSYSWYALAPAILLASGTVYLLARYLVFYIVSKVAAPEVYAEMNVDFLNVASICVSVLCGLSMLVVAKPITLWWLAAVASLVNVCFWMVVLFNPNYHARLLQNIGYGGGLPVSVYVKGDSSSVLLGAKYLVLRSSSSLLLYDDVVKKVIEVPINEVVKIVHDSGGFNQLASKLP